MDEAPVPHRSTTWVLMAFEAALGGVALGLGLLIGHSPTRTLLWQAADLLTALAWAVPPVVLFAVTWRWPLPSLVQIREQVDRLIGPMLRDAEWAELVLLSLAAGVGEELLFRGLVQGALADWIGTWPALAVASIAFGLGHAVTRTYAVLAVLMGAYLGWVWIETGNLLVPITVHAVYDLVALVVFVRHWRRQGAP